MYIKAVCDEIGPKIQVVGKYNAFCDMVMGFRCLGGNNIFNISSPLKIPNTSSVVSNKLEDATQLIDDVLVSDWFGPHKVYAVSNADGDKQGLGGFVGGSHNYNNNENPNDATATGRSCNVKAVIDGVTYRSSFEGYANHIDIYWDTFVQACNTVKADGSGREVLVEHHRMSSDDGTTWYTETDIEFLEEVKWMLFYGMQCINGNSWNGEIRYDCAEWQSIACSDTFSDNRLTETITVRKNGHYLEMYLDSSYGLGDRRYLDSNITYGAFSKIYHGFGKSYFHLVNSKKTYMKAKDIASYRGYYRFYYQK